MTHDAFNAFRQALPATTHVIRWGDSHVWKVGGKVFAIGNGRGYTFKVSPLAYEVLREQPGSRPAPYLVLTRHEMDPAPRQSRPWRRRSGRSYSPVAWHRRARSVEDAANRAWIDRRLTGPRGPPRGPDRPPPLQ